MTRALSVALIATACGASPPAVEPGPPPPPVVVIDAAPPLPLDQDLPRLAKRATALYRDVAQAFEAAGEDCAVATSKLEALQATYADVIAANAKVLHENRARDLRVALEPHAAVLDAAAQAIVQSKTMAACAAVPAFTDTFDALVGAPP